MNATQLLSQRSAPTTSQSAAKLLKDEVRLAVFKMVLAVICYHVSAYHSYAECNTVVEIAFVFLSVTLVLCYNDLNFCIFGVSEMGN